MRARAGLAECLWEFGEKEAAVEHLWAMLRLNPSDNQGLRYLLRDFLWALGDDEGLERLFNEFEDEYTAEWRYARALWLFACGGEGEDANRALTEAIDCNPHVPRYLMGKRRLPRSVESWEVEDAIEYAVIHRQEWQQTYGALRWLRHQTKRTVGSGFKNSG